MNGWSLKLRQGPLGAEVGIKDAVERGAVSEGRGLAHCSVGG